MVRSCPYHSSVYRKIQFDGSPPSPAFGVRALASFWGIQFLSRDVVSALLNHSSEERGFRHAAARDFDPTLPRFVRLIYSPAGESAEDARMRSTMNRGDQSIPLQTGRTRPMQEIAIQGDPSPRDLGWVD